MITLDRTSKHASKCDLCGGDPECVKHCREKAILYEPVDKVASYRRDAVAKLHRREGKRSVLSGGRLG
jgi:Fe-S-cluster-containing dehydrogenase component